jgi:hypothetical protein
LSSKEKKRKEKAEKTAAVFSYLNSLGLSHTGMIWILLDVYGNYFELWIF